MRSQKMFASEEQITDEGKPLDYGETILPKDVSKASVDDSRYMLNNSPQNEISEAYANVRMERDWQIDENYRHSIEKQFYERLIRRKVPKTKKKFVENPFYFTDCSNANENSGYGDYYMYGLYAGWPQVLMVDRVAFMDNRPDFMKQSLLHNLSHRNSLTSSASTTQLVGSICSDALHTPLLNLLRPRDPEAWRRVQDRHSMSLTKKKDHNKEVLRPYVGNISYPKRFPIRIDPREPFPQSLSRFERKQHHRKMIIRPDFKKIALMPKYRPYTEKENIFIGENEFVPKKDRETQTTNNILVQDLNISGIRRLEVDKLKREKEVFLENKRIPLSNYQNIDNYREPPTGDNIKGFYDIQPKVETPWLTKRIKDKQFTRKYCLDNYKGINQLHHLSTPANIAESATQRKKSKKI